MNARCKTEVVQHPAYALLLRQSVARTPHPPSQTAHHLLQADQRMSRVGPGVDGGVGFFVKYLWSQLQRHIRTKPLPKPSVCVRVYVWLQKRERGGEGDCTHPNTLSRAQPVVATFVHLRERKQRSKRGLMEDERRSRVFNGNVYSIIRSPVAVRQSNISDKKVYA